MKISSTLNFARTTAFLFLMLGATIIALIAIAIRFVKREKLRK